MTNDQLIIADKSFNSRLFTGTGKFANNLQMLAALNNSESELVTMALKRLDLEHPETDLYTALSQPQKYSLLPNTSGAKTAQEAVQAALIAREVLGTNWLKLEIHPDPRYLMPDAIETLKAAEKLCDLGFVVLPYVHADPVLCKHLEQVGCAAVMPLAAPIGSNAGLKAETFIEIIIEQAKVPVIVDAGIGAPSHAARAMEMGADAVLVNTAIAVAKDPILMASAFKLAVKAGREAYLSGLGQVNKFQAVATSPLTGFLS